MLTVSLLLHRVSDMDERNATQQVMPICAIGRTIKFLIFNSYEHTTRNPMFFGIHEQ